MPEQRLSPDTETFAKLVGKLQKDYRDKDKKWRGSPFAWVRACASSQKGKIGEKVISAYLKDRNFNVEPSPDREADRLINGQRVEIKTSLLWIKGLYKFQQMRPTQNYDFIICLGISPFDVHCWVISKQTLIERIESGDIKYQHSGKKGTDTAWLSVKPAEPQEWLSSYGGDLKSAVKIIAQLTR